MILILEEHDLPSYICYYCNDPKSHWLFVKEITFFSVGLQKYIIPAALYNVPVDLTQNAF